MPVSVDHPAACASPLNAWQTRMTLSRVAESVPYVSYATRTGQRVFPHSRGSGSGRLTNCGPTVPAEPAIEIRDVITSFPYQRIRETTDLFKTVGDLGGIDHLRTDLSHGLRGLHGSVKSVATLNP